MKDKPLRELVKIPVVECEKTTKHREGLLTNSEFSDRMKKMIVPRETWEYINDAVKLQFT